MAVAATPFGNLQKWKDAVGGRESTVERSGQKVPTEHGVEKANEEGWGRQLPQELISKPEGDWSECQ